MWANWIRTVLTRTAPGPRRKPRARRDLPARRPRLDPLEDRTVPAAFRLGSVGFDAADAVAADAAGNLYVAGSFNGTVDFDPGAGTTNLTNADTTADAFLAKYTSAGALLWVGQLVNSSATGLAVDSAGAVYVTGSFNGTVDFDFGSGVTNLTSGPFGTAFVAKYTAAGGLGWARAIGTGTGGTGGATNGDAITLDAAGNVYSAGVLSNGTADFDPGAGTFNLTNVSGNANTYFSKLDSSGNFVWAKQFANDPATAAGVWPAGLAVDAAQNVYVTGIFVGRVDFDTGAGTNWVSTFDTTFPSGDGYAARLTAAGDLSYVDRVGSATGREDGYGVVVDGAGTAYVAGHFSGTATIDATAGDTTLTSAGNDDAFVMRLDPTGGLVWARRVGSTGFDGAQAIATDGTDLYLSGYYSGTVDFDPGPGVNNITWAGGPEDVFALRLRTDGTFVNAASVGGTDYEYGNGIAVTGPGAVAVAGRFQGSGDFDPGPGIATLTSAGDNDAFVAAFPLAGANGPPIATDDAYTTDEDTSLLVAAPGVLGNDTDPAGNPLTAVLVAGPAHGTLTLNANGSFTYRPARNYNGPDSFTYKANDGTADSNVATVSITVNPVNDAPLGIPQTLTTAEETAVSGQVRGLDFDNDPLTFSLERTPDHGAVTLNPDGTFTYTPALNFNGQDGFLFRVTDPSGASGVSGVVVNVTPVNDAPTAADDAYSIDEDGTLVIGAGPAVSRLHMISDPGDFVGQGLVWDFDPATATFSARTNFDNGVEVTVDPPGAVEEWDLNFAAPGDVPLTPAEYLNATRWPFQAATEPGLDVSGYGRGLNRLVGQFTVYDVGYGPTGTVTRFAATFVQQDDPFTGPDGPPLYGAIVFNSTFGAGRGVLANDADAEGELLLGATLVTSPVHGDLAFNRDGSFVYTPFPNFHGTDTFTYRTADARADSAVATVTLTVNPVNDAPVAVDGSAATDEDTAVNGNVTATDVDGDALAYALVSGPAHGSLAFNADGSFAYTPAANYNGSDSFTFKANDGTADSNAATFALTVRPVNDAPVANPASFSTDEDAALSGTVGATDVEGDPLTYSLVTGPAHGTLTLTAATGAFTYTPAADYNGSDAFTFRANDGSLNSGPATVSVTVNPVNDAPGANSGTAGTDEDTALNGNVSATDVDGDALSFALVGGPAHGTLALNADGSFTYTPAADYNGPDGFTFKANDGTVDSNTATFAITVRPVNDAPVAAAASFSTDEDTAVTGSVGATDVDGDPLTYTRVAGPSHGALTLNADGTFTYTPAANFNGPDSFTFRASDGRLTSNVATVTLTVRPVNDAPAAANDTYTTDADTALTVPAAGVLANDADADGDALSAVLVTGPANGTVTLNADGSFRYTPAGGFSGADTFTYKASDGTADSNVATVTVRVAPAGSTEGKVTGGGSVDGGRRRFNVNVQSKARPAGGFALSGSLTFVDLEHHLRLVSTAIRGLTVDASGTRAVITGSATVNRRAGYTFTLIVEDVREPGVGADTFRLLITGPNGFAYDSIDFTGLSVLTDGNLQVRKKT
jgi:VCBS repeat-containing protein